MSTMKKKLYKKVVIKKKKIKSYRVLNYYYKLLVNYIYLTRIIIIYKDIDTMLRVKLILYYYIASENVDSSINKVKTRTQILVFILFMCR